MILNDEDAINVPESAHLDKGTTFTVSEIKQWIHSKLPQYDDQLTEGIEGRILLAEAGGGWKEGIIKIEINFTEQTPKSEQPDQEQPENEVS